MVRAPSDSAISIHDLRASYANKEVLSGFNLELKKREICALLGPNGAGKTTLLRCLSGLMRPQAGTLSILGKTLVGNNPFPPDLLKHMGILIESPEAYGRMSTLEYLYYWAGFYSQEIPKTRIAELAEAFELDSLTTRISKLSQGNRRKVQLIRSLYHKPSLILWDEPTEHLDPRSQKKALETLRLQVSLGAAALVTSHRLEQMEEWADHFGFLFKGNLIHALTRSDLNVTTWAELVATGPNPNTTYESLTNLSPPEWGYRITGANAVQQLSDLVAIVVQGGGRILRAEPKKLSLSDHYYRHLNQ